MNILDGIQLFRRAAERQSFSAAAQELRIAQPTVSKTVAMLETRLGVQLFRRSRRGLSLTAAGERLLAVGVPALERLEDALAQVRDEPHELTGQLRIESDIAFARYVIVPMLDEFAAMHPELRPSFVLHDRPPAIIRDGIDVAIRFGRVANESLIAMRVGSARRAIYAAPKYLERFGRPATIEDLRRHRFVYFNAAHDRPRWRLDNPDGSVHDFHFEPYIQADASDVIRETLIAGLGISHMPTWMMSVPEREGRVVRLLEEYCAARHTIFVVTAGPRPMSAKQRAFASFLRQRLDTNAELRIRS